MKSKDLIGILKDLGLSETESRVYTAALSRGPASVLQIARSAMVKRTTTYTAIESLQQKGLMIVEVRGFKRFFVAENPERLELMLNLQKEKLRTMMPEFTTLYNLRGGESFIKYYTGLEAIKSVYEGLLKDVRPHEDYLIISNPTEWISQDEKYFKKFLERRAKLNISIRSLFQDTPFARELKKFEKNYNQQVKLLPPNTTLTTNLVVIPKRVVIHQLLPPLTAIVIENRSVIQMHRELFEIIWKRV